MSIQEWKDKAFAGGYAQIGFPEGSADLNTMLLSPIAWQAVGKVEGWRRWDTDQLTPSGNNIIREGYTLQMHRMTDALAEGKTIEQFLETL